MKNLKCAFRGVFGEDGRRVFMTPPEKSEARPPEHRQEGDQILRDAFTEGLTEAERKKPDSRRVAEADAGGKKEGKATASHGEKALGGVPDIKAVTVEEGADKAKETARDAAGRLGERAQALVSGNAAEVAAVRAVTNMPVIDGRKLDSRKIDQARAEAAGLVPFLQGRAGRAAQEAAKATPDLTAALAKLKAPTLPTEDQGVTFLGSRGPASGGEAMTIGGTGFKTKVERLADGKQEPGKTAPALSPQMASLEARIAANTPQARIAAQERVRSAAVDTHVFTEAKRLLEGAPRLLTAQRNTLTTIDDGKIFRALVQSAGGDFSKFTKDYLAAQKEGELKTGAQVETFQRAWAKVNCKREDIYADIARVKDELHAETRIAIDNKTKQPAKPLARLGYEVAQALGLGAKSLSGAEVAQVYGVAFMPSATKEFVFNPVTKEIRAVGTGQDGSATLLASFELPKDTSPQDMQRKEYLAKLKTEKGAATA